MAEDEKTSKESEEVVQPASGIQAADKIIADYASKTVAKQQHDYTNALDGFDTAIKFFNNLRKLEYRIKFICVIKPNVITVITSNPNNKKLFVKAENDLRKFIEFIRETVGNTDSIIYKEINQAELFLINIKIHGFLEQLQINISVAVDNMPEEVKINFLGRLIYRIDDAVSFFTEIEERIKSKKKTVGNLNEQAVTFRNKSKGYKKTSYAFLACSLAIVISLAFLAYCQRGSTTMVPHIPIRDYLYFHLALETIFSVNTLLSITLLATFFSGLRFYAVNNHNAIVCDQRAITLESYENLSKAATTEQDRQVLLQKILDVATDHQPSGFVKEGRASDNLVEKALAAVISSSKRQEGGL